MTSPSTIFRALHQPEGTQCTRCGSFQVFPDPNPLAALAGFVHFARWYCRDCSGRFWVWAEGNLLRGRNGRSAPPDAVEGDEVEAQDDGHATEGATVVVPDEARRQEDEEELPPAPALDALVRVETAPAADLSALDAELARLNGTGPETPRPKRRRKRASAN